MSAQPANGPMFCCRRHRGCHQDCHSAAARWQGKHRAGVDAALWDQQGQADVEDGCRAGVLPAAPGTGVRPFLLWAAACACGTECPVVLWRRVLLILLHARGHLGILLHNSQHCSECPPLQHPTHSVLERLLAFGTPTVVAQHALLSYKTEKAIPNIFPTPLQLLRPYFFTHVLGSHLCWSRASTCTAGRQLHAFSRSCITDTRRPGSGRRQGMWYWQSCSAAGGAGEKQLGVRGGCRELQSPWRQRVAADKTAKQQERGNTHQKVPCMQPGNFTGVVAMHLASRPRQRAQSGTGASAAAPGAAERSLVEPHLQQNTEAYAVGCLLGPTPPAANTAARWRKQLRPMHTARPTQPPNKDGAPQRTCVFLVRPIFFCSCSMP